MKQIVVLAAVDKNYAIGRGNALPWQQSQDLAIFKFQTEGNVVLMGRNTAVSIGRVLPNRVNLVLTSQERAPFEGQIAVRSIEEALTYLDKHKTALRDPNNLFVIGGAGLYREALPMAKTVWLSHMDCEVEDADTWFPKELMARFEIIAENNCLAKKEGQPDFVHRCYASKP